MWNSPVSAEWVKATQEEQISLESKCEQSMIKMLDATTPGGAGANPESKLAGMSRGRTRLLLKPHHRLL